MINVDISKFQYDIGILDGFNKTYYDKFINLDRAALKENGHLEYILKIYSTGALLDSNSNQAYHPPLHHIISASFLKVLDLLNVNNFFKIELLEFLPFIYSILILLVVLKIMKEIGLSKKEMILPFSIIACHPLFIFMSRLINNDELVLLFTLITILLLLKWYKNPTYKNAIILGLSVGLGAMTKTSIIVMAIPITYTYIKKLSEALEDFKIVKKILFQGLIFAIIALPLVFIYPLRNAIKFGQPMFSVVTALDSLKVASTNFFDRWILNGEILNTLLFKNASNVWAYVINSSIFFMMEASIIPIVLSSILKSVSIILIIISFIGIVKYTTKSSNKNLLYILCLTYITWIISFIYFNISMPYSCTMHVRYIVTSMIIGIIYIGIFCNNIKNKNIKRLLEILIFLFNIISIIFVIYLAIHLKILV